MGVSPMTRKFGDVMKLVRFALMSVGAIVLALAQPGCAGDGSQPLTPSGTLDLGGTEPVKLKAPADGQINVYDVTMNDLIYSGLIHKDEEIVVDPVARTVKVNGQLANSKPLHGGETLKILFEENK